MFPGAPAFVTEVAVLVAELLFEELAIALEVPDMEVEALLDVDVILVPVNVVSVATALPNADVKSSVAAGARGYEVSGLDDMLC